jgi:dTDP-4-dehydrorhamnose reductase
MKILLTGASGQVGYELERSLQGLGDVIAVGRARMDLADLDQARNGGLYHLAAQGQTSWCGFAEAIMAAAGTQHAVTPIDSDAWPTAAAKPRNSAMCTDKLTQRFCRLPDWRDALRLCLE